MAEGDRPPFDPRAVVIVDVATLPQPLRRPGKPRPHRTGRRFHIPPGMVALYRAFDGDTLLYVGITNSPDRRFGQHRAAPWWMPEVRSRSARCSRIEQPRASAVSAQGSSSGSIPRYDPIA